MDEGKLPLDKLSELLKLNGHSNEGIINRGKVGLDVAVIDVIEGQKKAQQIYDTEETCVLVLKSDPITFPTPEPGKYAVIVNANDMSCAGALPFGFLTTIIAPPKVEFNEILLIQKQIHDQCNKLGISILGGHTEISSSVNTVVVSGHMFGFVPRNFLVPNELNIGDRIFVLGYCGAEGTGIIISQAGSKVKEVLSSEEIEEGKRIGKDILILEKALKLNKLFKPSLFHDATEGGIFGALTELVAYNKVGIELDSLPPLSPITEKLSKWLKFDPYRLISSGALIMAVSSEKSTEVKNYLQKENIPFAEVGSVIENEGKVIYQSKVLELPKGDEIIIALENLRRLQNVP